MYHILFSKFNNVSVKCHLSFIFVKFLFCLPRRIKFLFYLLKSITHIQVNFSIRWTFFEYFDCSWHYRGLCLMMWPGGDNLETVWRPSLFYRWTRSHITTFSTDDIRFAYKEVPRKLQFRYWKCHLSIEQLIICIQIESFCDTLFQNLKFIDNGFLSSQHFEKVFSKQFVLQ